MADPELVSCIIIFFNGARFLAEAVESVFAQTYPDWEMLLVDDGSTDESSAMARNWARQQPDRIRYLEHPGHENRGMSAARNLGLRAARGNYVGFLDADDIWLPNKLSEQVALFHHHPAAAMVYGRTLIWHSWEGNQQSERTDSFVDLGIAPERLVQPPGLFPLLLENRAQTPTTCNVLLRCEAVAQVGGFEESFRGMYEDQAFFAKTHLQLPIYVASTCWAKYRQHPDSTSATQTENYFQARLRYLRWVRSYLTDENRSYPPEVWSSLRGELRRCRYQYLRTLPAQIRRQFGAQRSRV